ncbi:MAG: HAMP domain-containing histidine kinase, partial [Actinobacteria bacterium]|nr:HAMP domain-containing histidine kinase [Actinomycetota bacterium]
MTRARRPLSLAARISLLSVTIAVLTALLAGALAAGLIRNNGAGAARSTLSGLADVAQTVTDTTATGYVTETRLRKVLHGVNVHTGVIRPDGQLVADGTLVKDAVTQADITAVLDGRNVSSQRDVAGQTVYVEARPDREGGIVLALRRADATAQDQAAIRRILFALVVAGAFAVVVGLLVAWRLARPLRRTAAAAHTLAAGNRDVALPAEGPAEVVEVSEAVNTLAAALRHSEARQRDFLLSVSHDLRTPLTAISGYAESLADEVVPPADAPRVGAVVLAEAHRLERLVGDLLDLARLDAQDFRVELAPAELGALARSAADVWAARCAGAGVAFHLDVPPFPVWTVTDAGRLRQALDGLFDNALRVTPAGAPIVLAVRADPGLAVVEVRDGGPGL